MGSKGISFALCKSCFFVVFSCASDGKNHVKHNKHTRTCGICSHACIPILTQNQDGDKSTGWNKSDVLSGHKDSITHLSVAGGGPLTRAISSVSADLSVVVWLEGEDGVWKEANRISYEEKKRPLCSSLIWMRNGTREAV
jgi:hypothetical protein